MARWRYEALLTVTGEVEADDEREAIERATTDAVISVELGSPHVVYDVTATEGKPAHA